MDRRCRVLCALTGCGAALIGIQSAKAQSVEEFYQKTRNITLIVSTATGGGYDNYARVLGRSFPRHVPGNPTMVIQNMPGAGGLRATNHMYNVAPKDGSTIALVHTSMVTAPLFGVDQANFDAQKFSYLGNIVKEPNFCVSWGTTPITRRSSTGSKSRSGVPSSRTSPPVGS